MSTYETFPENQSSYNYIIHPNTSRNESFFNIDNQQILSPLNSSLISSIDEDKFSEQSSKEDEGRYYVDKTKKSSFNFINPSIYPQNKKIKFVTYSVFKKKPKKKLKKKRYRNTNKVIHSKFGSDNITTRIQVNSMNSAFSYINEILSHVYKDENYKPKFKKIKSLYKKNYTKKNSEKIKKMALRELVNLDITGKYKNYDADFNRKVYEKIKDNEIVKNILDEKYINFFREVFYKNKRTINLNEHSINITINLSNKVKLYENLFREKDNEEYRDRVKQIIEKKFF